MKPEINYYVEGSVQEKPKSVTTVYVDGVSGNYRSGQDVELSHWVINKTPEKYKAPTSTEICFNYLDNPEKEYDLVVNNHLDVDGVLSMFSMAYPTLALQHRQNIITAAEMGDFLFWGTGKALNIFMAIHHLIQQNKDPQKIVAECFDKTINILERNQNPHPVESILLQQKKLMDDEQITRTVVSDRLVVYEYDQETIDQIKFPDEDLSPHFYKTAGVLPHVRNYFDKEKMQLTVIKKPDGNIYELCAPTYWWADTRQVWKPDWVKLQGQNYYVMFPELEKLIKDLKEKETNKCQWAYNPKLKLYGNATPSFPAILATVNNRGDYVVSHQCPLRILEELEQIFY